MQWEKDSLHNNSYRLKLDNVILV